MTDASPANEPAPDAGAQAAAAKLKGVRAGGGSAARKYFDLTYGPMPRWKAALMELVVLVLSGLPGALGLFLRAKLYRPFFGSCGRGVVIGRHVTLRHPSKIFLGDGVVIDDTAVVDAKGDGNRGIAIDDGAYVGRNTIVYCKGGEIEIGKNASLSADCIVFSSNRLVLGASTMVGSFSYLLSGGDPITNLSSTAGDTDLLVTWLYKLTIEKQYYNIGAVVGILTFVILAIGSLLTYRNSKSYKEEGGF